MSEQRTTPPSSGPVSEELRFDDEEDLEQGSETNGQRPVNGRRWKPALWTPRRGSSGEEDPRIHPEPPEKPTPSVLRYTVNNGYQSTWNGLQNVLHPRLWQEWHDLQAEVWELRHVQGLYTASNSKGGVGKTPLITYLAALRSWILRNHFILIIDTNEVTGSTAYRLGVHSSKTLLLPEFLANQGIFRDHAVLGRKLEFHPESGLAVMTNRAIIPQRDMALMGKLESGLVIARLASHEVWCDPGNGTDHWANLVPARMADVLLLPAKAGEKHLETRQRLQIVTDFYRDEEKVIADRLDTSFVVILGSRDKEKEYYAEEIGWDPERVFMVPRDHHMEMQTPNNISIARLRLRTKVALARILVAMLKQPRNPHIYQLAEHHGIANREKGETGEQLFRQTPVEV